MEWILILGMIQALTNWANMSVICVTLVLDAVDSVLKAGHSEITLLYICKTMTLSVACHLCTNILLCSQ